MANFKSKQVAAGYPAPTPIDAVALLPITAEYTAKTGDAIGDIVEMGAIPAGCVVVDLVVDTGALGAGVTLDAGILSGNFGDAGVRTMGNEFFAAQAATTASVIRRNKAVNTIATELSDKSWGIKFLGAAPAAGQSLRATLTVRPAPVAM